tara:strand:+ start:346 stop:930 length:585 start_codon:yes stop_codon:yes gene_type:complete
MLESPFQYDDWLTPDQFQKLGELMLRWSHFDHVIGNCLGAILQLSPEDTAIMVFPLPVNRRLTKIKELAVLRDITDDAEAALTAVADVFEHIQKVRNNVIHAIMIDDPNDGLKLHLRSKKRALTIDQVFEIEELTNYAAHCALSLRYALGPKAGPVEQHPLPDKPAIPRFLNHPSPTEIQLGQPLAPRPPASRE